MAELSGKRALITGGASGIGKATAKLFARRGAGICIADVDAAAGQGVADEIIIEGGRAIFVRCDVSSAVECQSAVQQMVAEFGGIDILFNNAGIIRRASVVDTTEDEWDRVMAVNVKSVFLLGK